jgi:plastocyanin
MDYVKAGVFAFLIVTIIISGCAQNTNLPPAGNDNTQAGQPQQPNTGTGGGITSISPSVAVSDQQISGNTVVVSKVVSDGDGWLVIHAEGPDGKPGTVLGQTAVGSGLNSDVVVQIDQKAATQKLFAMLHVDAGEKGAYEFPGTDVPAKFNGEIVMQDFTATNVSSQPAEQTPPEQQPPAEPPGTTPPADTSANVKEFDVTAKSWEFVPSTITVNKGDTVKLHLTSTDVGHGFVISAYGINKTLNPGQQVDVEFVADQAGSFPFYCNVFCGEGHKDMKGTLVVNG